MILIDPVAYDWDLGVLDLDRFVEAWNRRQSPSPGVIILDTTLVGDTFPVAKFRARLNNVALFCHLASGLKLDQEGLELNNIGFLSVQATDHQDWATRLRQVRESVSHGLPYAEACELDTHFFLSPGQLRDYGGKIYANNRFLAEQIVLDGPSVFKRVAYPGIHDSDNAPWAVAPFVIFHLEEDTLLNQGLLLEVLAQECRRLEIPFHTGASFGFRFPRYEVIVPLYGNQNSHFTDNSTNSPRSLFKVAMGAYNGSFGKEIVDLLSRISSFANFEELRRAYPEREYLPDNVQMNMTFRIFAEPESKPLALTPGEIRNLSPEQRNQYEILPKMLSPDGRYWSDKESFQPSGRGFHHSNLYFWIPKTAAMPGPESHLLFSTIESGKAEVANLDLLMVNTGAGIEAVLSALHGAKSILSTDPLEENLQAGRANYSRNLPGDKRANFIQSDLLSGINRDRRFHLIVFNPPAQELIMRNEAISPHRFEGADIAYRFLDQIIEKNCLTENGKVLLALSNSCDLRSISTYYIRHGFCLRIVDHRDRPGSPNVSGGSDWLLSFSRQKK